MITDLRAADWSTPAVMLKFDQNMLHHGSLGVIRSLGRLGVPVYGVHEGPWAPAASSRYLSGRLFWQPRPDDPQRTLSGLLSLASRIGRRAVLFATDDAGAIFLAEHGDALRDAFRSRGPPADLPRRLAGKYSMFQLCRDLGVPTPQAMLAWSPGEAADVRRPGRVPAHRQAHHAVARDGARGPAAAQYHDHPDRCRNCGRYVPALEATSTGLMLQEYIPPAPGQDWFFHGYIDSARPLPARVHRGQGPLLPGLRRADQPGPGGAEQPAGAGRSPRWLAAIGFRGIVDLDLRFDPRDGQYKLLDFNPRLGAQFRLFTTGTGVDVVRAAYLDLTGQPVAAGEMTRDRRFLVENYDPLGAVGYWRRGELGLRSWVASLRPVDELAWFARDDLRPFGLMCARMAWRAVSRGAGAAGPGPSVLLRAADGPLPAGRAPRHAGPVARRGPGTSGYPHSIPATARSSPRQGGEEYERTTMWRSWGRARTGSRSPRTCAGPGVSFRQFGLPMHLWRATMPRGMFLKSQGFASNLSDPAATLTLDAFCGATGRPYADYGLPVPLDTFVAYGEWFQSAADLDVEEVLVTGVSPAGDGYQLDLADGETLRARQVVVAVGVEHFAYLPERAGRAARRGLHAQLGAHRPGGLRAASASSWSAPGQSALESAALLHEHGAQVRIVMRESSRWPGTAPRSPRTGRCCSGCVNPRPASARAGAPGSTPPSRASSGTCPRPPGSTGPGPRSARPGPAGCAAGWRASSRSSPATRWTGRCPGPTGSGSAWSAARALGPELAADHVIAATGYRPDLGRLTFLDEGLRSRLRTVAGTPVVDRDYQTSVPGLYVVGPGVAPTFGPVMRFVYGADHAARTVGRRLACAGATRRADRGRGEPGRSERAPDRRASLGRRPGRAVGAGFPGARERPG